MKTIKQLKEYTKPSVDIIKIDTQISLAMDSAPTKGPEESINNPRSELLKSEVEKC
jgi:hypothetical protein